MERTYSFAIVRVSPDPRRGELVNIGIAVFLPGKLDVRILVSLAKVEALHGELDLSQLHALPQRLSALAAGRRSVAERHALIRSVGMVELSGLGQFRARDTSEYEQQVGDLLTRLVRPTVASRRADTAPTRLHARVRQIIKEAKILGKAGDQLDAHKIVPHYPLAPGKGLYADFAGMNSRFHVTETIDFRVDRGIQGPKFNESAKAAFVLRESQKQFNTSKRVLLYAASHEIELQVRPHLNLLEEFATDFVNFESAQDRARFVGDLAAAFGGELPLAMRP